MNGRMPQLRADFQEVDVLGGAGFGHGRTDVAQLRADQDFGPLLVEANDAGRGDDVRVADRFHGVEKGAERAVEKAERQAAGAEIHVADAARRTAAGQRDMGIVAEQRKIDAELIAVVELDAENHRLDGDLQRTLVDLGHDLVDLREHRLVVAHQHGVAAGEAIAAGLVVESVPIPTSAGPVTLIAPTPCVNSGVIRACMSEART